MDRDRTDPYGFGRRDERPRGDGGDGGRDLASGATEPYLRGVLARLRNE